MAFAMAAVAVLVPGVPALAAGTLENGGIEIGGVFGNATASARDLTSVTIELDLAVQVDGEATVVAHLIEPGGAQETLPLPSRGEGVFGIRIEVRKIDYVVVFEAIEGSLASQSQPLRLTELGVDPAILGVLTVPPTQPEEISSTTRQWGWAGLGLAAAALTLLAFWAVPDRRRRAQETQRIEEAQTAEAVEAPEAVEATVDAGTMAEAETTEEAGPEHE